MPWRWLQCIQPFLISLSEMWVWTSWGLLIHRGLCFIPQFMHLGCSPAIVWCYFCYSSALICLKWDTFKCVFSQDLFIFFLNNGYLTWQKKSVHIAGKQDHVIIIISYWKYSKSKTPQTSITSQLKSLTDRTITYFILLKYTTGRHQSCPKGGKKHLADNWAALVNIYHMDRHRELYIQGSVPHATKSSMYDFACLTTPFHFFLLKAETLNQY